MKELDIVGEFTYLGVKLTSTGNFNAHLNQTGKRKGTPCIFLKLTEVINFKELKLNAENR